jgi:hypothetical protein
MRLTRPAFILGVLLCAPRAFASEEGVLVWSSFSVHSAGIGSSGLIDVSGTYGGAGVEQLVVKAFGKEYVLSSVQLRQLQGVHVNGMQMSYEAGYAELGGRSIYLVLSMGFTSGTRAAKRITLNERGDITIGMNQRAAEQ